MEGACRTLRQFPLVAEQHVQIAVIPLRRGRCPGPFQTAANLIAAFTAAITAFPAQALLFDSGCLGFRSHERRIAGTGGSEAALAAALDGGNATFLKSDLFSKLPRSLQGGVDVVTIHPPYVPRQVVSELPVEVKKFEPHPTLTDGSVDGLGLVRRVVDESFKWLRPGGWLLIEVTPDKFRDIRRLLRTAGYAGIRSTHGSLRHTRVILART